MSTADGMITVSITDLNADLDAAREEGHRSGLDEGHRAGYDEGYDQGNADGWDDGYIKGREDALAELDIREDS